MSRLSSIILLLFFFASSLQAQRNKSQVNSQKLFDALSIPSASFLISPENCIRAGDTLMFTSIDPSVTGWFWDFGDGTYSTLQNPTHVYTDFGYFCINATASNACGSSTVSELVFIVDKGCDCQYAWTIEDTIVSNNTDWNSSTMADSVLIRGDLIIASGNSMAVNGINLYFSPRGRIIVENGASLTLTNCTLDVINPCMMWQGIEVWGNTNEPSTSITEQGYLYLNENVVIQNAHIGVLLGKRNMDYICDNSTTPQQAKGAFTMEKSGGVIVAGPQAAINQSKFVNNGIDIKFNRKINTDGTANQLNSLQFTSTVLNEDQYSTSSSQHYPNAHNPWTGHANALQRTWRGIEMSNLRGVDINHCNFDNKEYGVYSANAQVDLFNDSITNVSYGFYAIHSGQSILYRHEVANCYFDVFFKTNGTGNAINILNGYSDNIHSNLFGDQSFSVTNKNNIAILMDYSSNYKISNNRFNNDSIGIIANWNKTGKINAIAPLWNGNYFYHCIRSIETRYDNQYLIIKCNDHMPMSSAFQYQGNWDNYGLFINWWPWMVVNLNLGDQGTNGTNPKNPAGNTFNLAQYKHIHSNDYFRYFHHGNNISTNVYRPVSVLPSILGVYATGALYPNDQVSCSSKFIIDDVIDIQDLPNLSTKMDSMRTAASFIWNDFTNALALQDNGNTLGLLYAIEVGMPQGQLKNLLIENSPLSDTVISHIFTYSPLSSGNFKNVMIPNLPVSDYLSIRFYEYIAGLPVGIRTQLEEMQMNSEGGNNATAKLRLYNQAVGDYKDMFIDVLGFLLDSNRVADARALLISDGSLESKQALLTMALEERNIIEATTQLAEIESMNELFVSDYYALWNIILAKYQQGMDIYNMDSLELESIYNIAIQCPPNPAVYNARGIYELLTGEHISDCPLGLNHRLPFVTPWTNKDCQLGENYPNPFSDYTIIPYMVPEDQVSYLLIYNSLGVVVRTIALNPLLSDIYIDTRNWESGVYFYTLFSGGNNLSSRKMILTK